MRWIVFRKPLQHKVCSVIGWLCSRMKPMPLSGLNRRAWSRRQQFLVLGFVLSERQYERRTLLKSFRALLTCIQSSPSGRVSAKVNPCLSCLSCGCVLTNSTFVVRAVLFRVSSCSLLVSGPELHSTFHVKHCQRVIEEDYKREVLNWNFLAMKPIMVLVSL